MHILQLSKRNDEAQKRILVAAAKLAKKAGLGVEYIAALSSQEKDTAIRTMVEREGVASLLEALLTSEKKPPAEKKPTSEKKPPTEKKSKAGDEPMSEIPALETTGENPAGDVDDKDSEQPAEKQE